MNEIRALNVNHAFVDALWKLKIYGKKEDSRAGPVLVMPGPVMTTYEVPQERVLFRPDRDANHVFHLMETIWMLAGGEQVSFLLPFNSTFGRFAEEDGIMHGAYGFRWRGHFGLDQIDSIIHMLRNDSNSRQAVMQMWDASPNGGNDLRGKWLDRPCNTHIYFDCRGGKLNMTVCNRSNDMLWGAYGSNVVHMSMLQEIIASGVGVPVGLYNQFSNNFHVYTDNPMVKDLLSGGIYDKYDLYSPRSNEVSAKAYPLVNKPNERWGDFIDDCENMVEGNHRYKTDFFTYIAEPLRKAYLQRKAGEEGWDSVISESPQDSDWIMGFKDWANRRAK